MQYNVVVCEDFINIWDCRDFTMKNVVEQKNPWTIFLFRDKFFVTPERSEICNYPILHNLNKTAF